MFQDVLDIAHLEPELTAFKVGFDQVDLEGSDLPRAHRYLWIEGGDQSQGERSW